MIYNYIYITCVRIQLQAGAKAGWITNLKARMLSGALVVFALLTMIFIVSLVAGVDLLGHFPTGLIIGLIVAVTILDRHYLSPGFRTAYNERYSQMSETRHKMLDYLVAIAGIGLTVAVVYLAQAVHIRFHR